MRYQLRAQVLVEDPDTDPDAFCIVQESATTETQANVYRSRRKEQVGLLEDWEFGDHLPQGMTFELCLKICCSHHSSIIFRMYKMYIINYNNSLQNF